MPELPEVEAIRRRIEPTVTGGRIVRVRIARRDVIRDPDGRRRGRLDPALLGQGRRIAEVGRRGKQLIIRLEGGRGMVVRLGMSGRLDLTDADRRRPAPPHRHLVWTIETDGKRHRLEFIDPRRFGGVHLARDGEDLDGRLLGGLGPEATTIKGRELHDRLRRTTRAIKIALLDQSVLAGVGNIYADEALHASGIHPERPGDQIDPAGARRLATGLRRILDAAIEQGGSTIRDHRLPDGSSGGFVNRLQVYGRSGRPCLRCTTTLLETRVAARRTTWCPICQPAKGVDPPPAA